MDEEGTPMAVQQKLMRHAPATIMRNHDNAASKPKAKTNGKVVRQVPAVSEFRDDASAEGSFLFKP
jgi:hypothetical protein